MNSQALDLRSSLSILRRYQAAVGLAVGLGLLAGVMFTALWPPVFTSRALVVLPAATRDTPYPSAIAVRPSVLAAVLRRLEPATSSQNLTGRVQITSLGSAIVAVSATEPSRAQAQRIANAVARNLIARLGEIGNPGEKAVAGAVTDGMAAGGSVPARLLQSATDATGTSFLAQLTFTGCLGVLVGGFVGFVGALAYGRRREPWRQAEPGAGLVRLGFLGAAMRRRAWLWCATGATGLLLGSWLYLVAPPAYQASISVSVASSPFAGPAVSVADDVAWAQGQIAARAAVRALGLRQSPGSLLGQYTAVVVAYQLIQITVSAPSASQAVHRANVIATEFLRTRAKLLGIEAQLDLQALDQQIVRSNRQAGSLGPRLARFVAPASSPTRLAEFRRLQTRYGIALSARTALQQQAASDIANTTTVTAGSQALKPADLLPRSQLGTVMVYVGGGLIIGVTLGLSSVMIEALGSGRPRQRDYLA